MPPPNTMGEAGHSAFEHFTVHYNKADITSLVGAVQLNESIYQPFLDGHLEITDGRSFADNHIRSARDYVVIECQYQGQPLVKKFYADGISFLDTTNIQTHKTYRLNLRSPYELGNALSRVSKPFDGDASQIISLLWDELLDKTPGAHPKLYVDSWAGTQGLYTCPNWSPLKAIGKIIDNSYTIEGSPMFLYERLWAEHPTKLSSWERMICSLPFYNVSPVLPDTLEGIRHLHGAPSKVMIRHDHDGEVDRAAAGVLGCSIKTVNLAASVPVHEQTYQYLQDVIDVGSRDSKYHGLLQAEFDVVHGIEKTTVCLQTGDDKQLISAMNAKEIAIANAIRSKMESVVIDVYSCRAMPKLKVGDTVTMDLPEGIPGDTTGTKERLSAKYTGRFVVATITHRMKDRDYEQDLTIIRDGMVSPDTIMGSNLGSRDAEGNLL